MRAAAVVIPRDRRRRRERAGRWVRFGLLLAMTAVLLAPVAAVVVRAFAPTWTASAFLGQLAGRPVLTWFGNSALLTAATVVAAVLVAAPAGYVLSRGRSRATSLFAILVFGMQSLPTVVFLVPLFFLLSDVGLVDDLAGLALVYVGLAVAIATWTMSATFDAIPVEIEEAAWLDGCSVFGAFRRVVLPNAGPGLLSTAVVTFLLAWNDYWIALVLIRSDTNRPLGLALDGGGGSPALAVLTLLPPLVVFAVFHRSFRFGGLAGSVSG